MINQRKTDFIEQVVSIGGGLESTEGAHQTSRCGGGGGSGACPQENFFKSPVPQMTRLSFPNHGKKFLCNANMSLKRQNNIARGKYVTKSHT